MHGITDARAWLHETFASLGVASTRHECTIIALLTPFLLDITGSSTGWKQDQRGEEGLQRSMRCNGYAMHLQACEACYSDAQAVDGSCAAACPSGSLQQAPLHPYIPASFRFADAVSAYNSSSPAQAALPGLASPAGTVVQRQLLAENRQQQAGLNARAFRAWLADGGSAATGMLFPEKAILAAISGDCDAHVTSHAGSCFPMWCINVLSCWGCMHQG